VWSRPGEGRRLSVACFANDASDLISFVPVNPATSKAFNVGRASIRGLEVELDLGRFGALSMRGNFTRLSALDRSDDAVARGRQLPGRPGYEMRWELGAYAGPAQLAWIVSAVGDDFAEKGERGRIPSRVLHGLRAQASIGTVALMLRADNLGDEKVFDLWGYPLPGRTVSCSISLGGFHAP